MNNKNRIIGFILGGILLITGIIFTSHCTFLISIKNVSVEDSCLAHNLHNNFIAGGEVARSEKVLFLSTYKAFSLLPKKVVSISKEKRQSYSINANKIYPYDDKLYCFSLSSEDDPYSTIYDVDCLDLKKGGRGAIIKNVISSFSVKRDKIYYIKWEGDFVFPNALEYDRMPCGMLYWADLDGSNETLLCKEMIISFALTEDTVILYMYQNGNLIFSEWDQLRNSIDILETEIISKFWNDFYVTDDWIIVQDFSKNNYYKLKRNGIGGLEILQPDAEMNEDVYSWKVLNCYENSIYYSILNYSDELKEGVENDDAIKKSDEKYVGTYKRSLVTNETIKISEYSYDEIYILDDEWIYATQSDFWGNETTYRFRPEDTKREKIY